MKIISHRGNINGPVEETENDPKQILFCIESGYDVEIDLRIKNGVPYLGHDHAEHEISAGWISSLKKHLWIHVKEYDALVWLMENVPDAAFFCHESDRYTLVSNGYVWSHDLSNSMTDKCIIPLLSLEQIESYDFTSQSNLYAVCTDYVIDCNRKWTRE